MLSDVVVSGRTARDFEALLNEAGIPIEGGITARFDGRTPEVISKGNLAVNANHGPRQMMRSRVYWVCAPPLKEVVP